MSGSWRFALLVLLPALAAPAVAEQLVFIDEGAFLNALTAMGYAAVHEGFENDGDWGAVRSSIPGGNFTAVSVISNGLTWSANNQSSEITTSSGAALSGNWGLYSLPHGSYTDPDPGADCYTPGECGDGWRGMALEGELIAIGGWVRTNTPYAAIGLYLSQYPDQPIDFGETCNPPGSGNCTANNVLDTQYRFFGVIDTAGIPAFEFRELEGKLEIGGGDIKYIFGDDFRFAFHNPDLMLKDGFE